MTDTAFSTVNQIVTDYITETDYETQTMVDTDTRNQTNVQIQTSFISLPPETVTVTDNLTSVQSCPSAGGQLPVADNGTVTVTKTQNLPPIVITTTKTETVTASANTLAMVQSSLIQNQTVIITNSQKEYDTITDDITQFDTVTKSQNPYFTDVNNQTIYLTDVISNKNFVTITNNLTEYVTVTEGDCLNTCQSPYQLSTNSFTISPPTNLPYQISTNSYTVSPPTNSAYPGGTNSEEYGPYSPKMTSSSTPLLMEIIKTKIVYTSTTVCPVTATQTSGSVTTISTYSTTSTIYSTSISTVMQGQVQPAIITIVQGQVQPAITTITQGEVSLAPAKVDLVTVIVSATTTICPVTNTYTSGSSTMTSTSTSTSTDYVTITSTICTKCMQGTSMDEMQSAVESVEADLSSEASVASAMGIYNTPFVGIPTSGYGTNGTNIGYGFTASGGLSTSTALPAAPRSDHRCGRDFGGAICDPTNPGGACCSNYGWCGSTPDFCSVSSCQSGCLEKNNGGASNSTSSNSSSSNSSSSNSASSNSSSSIGTRSTGSTCKGGKKSTSNLANVNTPDSCSYPFSCLSLLLIQS